MSPDTGAWVSVNLTAPTSGSRAVGDRQQALHRSRSCVKDSFRLGADRRKVWTEQRLSAEAVWKLFRTDRVAVPALEAGAINGAIR
jgi:hypothetical protein